MQYIHSTNCTKSLRENTRSLAVSDGELPPVKQGAVWIVTIERDTCKVSSRMWRVQPTELTWKTPRKRQQRSTPSRSDKRHHHPKSKGCDPRHTSCKKCDGSQTLNLWRWDNATLLNFDRYNTCTCKMLQAKLFVASLKYKLFDREKKRWPFLLLS